MIISIISIKKDLGLYPFQTTKHRPQSSKFAHIRTIINWHTRFDLLSIALGNVKNFLKNVSYVPDIVECTKRIAIVYEKDVRFIS